MLARPKRNRGKGVSYTLSLLPIYIPRGAHTHTLFPLCFGVRLAVDLGVISVPSLQETPTKMHSYWFVLENFIKLSQVCFKFKSKVITTKCALPKLEIV